MSFMRYLNINTTVTPSPTVGITSKQVLLIGQRNTGGVLIPTTNGFTQPNYYVPFLLPSFPNGNSALNYLKNYGIQLQIGINITLDLPEPDIVVSSNNLTTVTWNAIPSGFSQLVGFNLSGILNQTTLNGNIYSAKIVGNTAVMVVYGTVAYTTTSVMTVNGLNNVNYPDPNATDPIALMVWDFYQTALSANSSALGTPACYISILTDRDTSISPTPAPIVLGVPASVTTGVTSTLTYPVSTAGLGYLPTTAFGNTSVTQTTSLATGIFGGYYIVGSNVIITVTNVTGTFDTTNSVSVVPDNTINCFAFLNNIELCGAVQQFPVTQISDITTRYADFYNGIELINQGNQVLNQHYGTFGCAGNITSLPNQAATLPSPSSQYNILVTYPYVAMFGDVPYENTAGNVAGGRVTSAVMYMLANGDAPYPPLMTATINHLPVSSVSTTTSYSGNQNGSGDIAVIQGWLPLAPNSSNVVAFLESNTTLITEPDTTVPDIEFRYTHIWQCVFDIKKQVANLFNTVSILPNNQGSALMSTAFIQNFRAGIVSILYQAQNEGVVQNVALYENLVTVTQDTQNPNQVDAYIPSQMIPQVNGANVNINVFSSLYTFSNTNQGV